MRRTTTTLLMLAVFVCAPLARSASPGPDEVLYWNDVLLRSIRTAGTPGPVQGRAGAIVHVAMFEALNGIEGQYEPIHDVGLSAPPGASRRAAVVQAAYTALLALFPTQSTALGIDLEASLESIAAEPAIGNSKSIQRGRQWGQQVAQAILTWRSTDGFDPSPSTYVGSMVIGKWRPTPPAFANGLVPSMAHTTPFVITSPSSFRPVGPPALTSAAYAANVEEVKSVGALASVTRTADQTESARFWAGTAGAFWNRTAATASLDRHFTLSQNARLFALLNVGIADAIIACWDSKYYFELWRPITAIQNAHLDGNPGTTQDPTWTPLIATPPYPEYDSGHQSVSGVSQAILTAYFGNDVPVSGFSEGFPGVIRSWPNFAAAADEAFLARIWSGIHFRFAMADTRVVAEAIAEYILTHAALPIHGGDVVQR